MNIPEALTRMRLVFAVAEHLSSNGHTAADALVRGIKLCDGNKEKKRQEMRLIFRLETCQLRGLDADFLLHLKYVCACKTQLSNWKFNTRNRSATHNEHSTDEGHSSQTFGHLLRFWHVHTFITFIQLFKSQ